MEITQAIELLKKTVKHSTATDEFRHMDLTLVPSSERAQYQEALKVISKAIRENEMTREEFEKQVGIGAP
ncbi:MAG: hypothetical protein H6620_06060 [Halobacteriovoraceae bacterium]|nr:hypothetical protein [Halobacteriovoraceae bacterium]